MDGTSLKYTYKHTHNNAKQMRKTNGCTKKNIWEEKKDEHTKERAEKWMRSNRKRQKMKKEIDKSGKKRKVLLVKIFVQNTWDFFFPLFSPIFSLIWGDCILVGIWRKYLCPTSFPSHFLLQIKTQKYHFLSFHLFPSKVTPTKWNQMGPMYTWMVLWIFI